MSLIKKGGTKSIKPEDLQKRSRQEPAAPEDGTKQMPSSPSAPQPPSPSQPPEDGTKQMDQGAPAAAQPAPPPTDDDGTRQVSQRAPDPARPKPAAEDTHSNLLQPKSMLQNRYMIESVLGIGGMSVVYRGRDLRFKDVVRPCAIKEMYQSSPDSKTRRLSLQFFQREAGMLATLNHPAIPKVYDFFEENGRVYLVQELIEGKDLETVLEEHGGPLGEARVGNWAVQICDVLSYLHNHQPESIVFRDMKPSNVVLTANDRIVLVDFGIARLLDRANPKGTMIGTEGYASPEQFRGVAEPVSDIYALGATLHQLLTNSDPRTETPFTFHERPIRKINQNVSAEMEAVISRALEYDMTTRWQNCEEFRLALLSVPAVSSTMPGESAASAQAPAAIRNLTAATDLVWSFACEDEIRGSPAASDGLLFIGCYDHNIYAIDLQRGEFRWKYASEGGISTRPDLWQDTLIVGSDDGVVYGVDIRMGKLRWTFRTAKPIRSSPRVYDRLVLVGSDDQHFYALDGMRGSLVWKYRTWMPMRSTACVADNLVYVGGDDGYVYCLDIRNGALRWKQKTQQPIISSPTFSDDLIYVGSRDNNLYALDSQGGWPAWRFRTGHNVLSSPCVVGNRVFVGSADGYMYAVDKKKGRLIWKFETDGQINSSPRSDGSRIYFGSADSYVYCLDTATGDLVWKYQTEGPVISSPLVLDGVVYIGSMDGKVYALKA